MQSQKWCNNLCSFPRQTIQYHSNPSLCHNQQCWRSWSWMVLWRPTRSSRTNTQKRCPFYKGDWTAKVQFSSVTQSCPTIVIPWTTACQSSLSITNFQSPAKPMSIESVMPFNHLILCRPFLLLPSIFLASVPMSQHFASGGQSIEVAASSVLPKNTQDWSPLAWTGWISLKSKGLSRLFSNTTVQKYQIFVTQISL